ncbi:cytochrome P450 [Rhodopseudomonas palustris]|uniref:Cytochrome P450 n=1 Tax=Rhodopseudomonas palustris (strain ATCC BAA-98 / CGA009) TaxID=258594 RepID=Q6N918_RHOPA|nr:cytochrome P450 [Rhodopseudomonas palustris]OPF94258.1 cytochrome P450 [Rhodopseudomonas palustris]PPQ41222.1 cytochrome P450 [Rhodopseudomonas palustris]QQM03234.1 1,8-cineole 2-endo-monooxygenase [Rhodopseudomonas palustris]RJF64286.1 cytochrome P450 [Rhodopseudomonas palustris]WAB79398.1 cytochrome P450 [Rhodopseudomonas palustris]
MSERAPVTDWVNDFDHTDPRWTENPYPIWDELRSAGPLVHTDRFLGCYMPTTFAAVKEISYDTDHFSSRRVIVRNVRSESPPPAPPITSDPPEHKPAKRLLLPPFTPDAVAKLEPRVRAICNELIDAFIEDEGCDAATAYTKHIPVKTICHMLGIPEDDSDIFIRWIHEILELGINDDAILMKAVFEMSTYFQGHIAHRKQKPTDDLISTLMNARDDKGQPLSDAHVLGSLRLLLIAGIDTTWSAIGAALWHLATHPADRERLLAEPELMPTAIEEFLRAYSPVTMAREVMKETSIAGCPVKPGNMVLLSFPAANRDPSVFPEADRVMIDRKENPHVAFGLGIHRCVGSNLARMEMTVAIEEWLKRIASFRLDPSQKVRWSEGTVRGPRSLPLLFGKPS